MPRNVVGWFELPVADMERAIAFYSAVLDISFHCSKMGELDMAWFPSAENGLGAMGSLVYHAEHYTPSTTGALLYFSSLTGNLKDQLDKVEAAGGKVLRPKTLITEEIGFMGVFLDTEGNRVAIHSKG